MKYLSLFLQTLALRALASFVLELPRFAPCAEVAHAQDGNWPVEQDLSHRWIETDLVNEREMSQKTEGPGRAALIDHLDYLQVNLV
jgi:hypothetical protein